MPRGAIVTLRLGDSEGQRLALVDVPALGTYRLGWASNPNTEWAVAAALTGAAISGRMPVPAAPGIPLGAGLTVAALAPAP